VSDTIKIIGGEAQVLSKYLIDEICSAEIAKRYEEAVNKLKGSFNEAEEKTWKNMIASPFYLKLVDSGLALANPQSALRKRIFIMLAILECTPEYTSCFLPQQRSIWYLLPLGFRAAMSAVFGIAGFITVKAFKV
jgi:hypothetical protein